MTEIDPVKVDPVHMQHPPRNPNPIIDSAFPSLNRCDLMSLQTLTSKDFPMRKFKQLDTARDWSVNLYNLDIEGSSPRRIGAFNQKIDYINKNDDIERSWPKILHMPLNKPEFNLTNEDIEYSKPGCVKIKTNRHLNPLEPKYTLPQSELLPFEEPKFIRDNIQIQDIEGAKPRKIMSKWQGRETNKKDDIPKTAPRKPYVRNSNYQYIDYRDVTNTEFKSGRLTNPLEPVYRLGYITGEKVTVGPIDGNKPVSFSKYKYEDPMNLKVNDIVGTRSGSKNHINKFNSMNFMYTSSDIFGAQSGTLKKGIVTKRMLNPLVPKYKYPGYDELQGRIDNNPYDKRGLKRLANTTVPRKRESGDGKEMITRKEESGIEKRETSCPQRREERVDEGKEEVIGNDKPFMQDVVKFDKENYVKPQPFYGYVHDEYLIPPVEEHRKTVVTPTTRSFAEISQSKLTNKAASLLKSGGDEGGFGTTANKKVSTSTFGPLGQTYAQKLDSFMATNNLKFIEPEAEKAGVRRMDIVDMKGYTGRKLLNSKIEKYN